jgi:hypothetical protein
MVIRQRREGSVEFFEVEPIEMDLLREIVTILESPGDTRSDRRLFSQPARESETEFLRDWSEFVEPELRQLFISARTVVKEDLTALQTVKGRHGYLKFPVQHSDAWLSTLNQVRLILAARHNFTERELSNYRFPIAFSKRELVLVQINFYAAIQERLIEILEGDA